MANSSVHDMKVSDIYSSNKEVISKKIIKHSRSTDNHPWNKTLTTKPFITTKKYNNNRKSKKKN